MSTNMTRFRRDQASTHITDLYGEFAPASRRAETADLTLMLLVAYLANTK